MDIRASEINLLGSLLNKQRFAVSREVQFPSVAVLKYHDLKQFKGGEDLFGLP